ncbi:MAG: GNAT family N-acetyltransferase [Crocinitomicaceae bacterium]
MREIIHDETKQEFVLKLENNEQAIVNYTMEDGKMKLVYSKVPNHLQGKGIGKELVEKTFKKLTEGGFKAKAVCSYIRVVAMRSSKWKEIIEY